MNKNGCHCALCKKARAVEHVLIDLERDNKMIRSSETRPDHTGTPQTVWKAVPVLPSTTPN
jgi:hypothetical protein